MELLNLALKGGAKIGLLPSPTYIRWWMLEKNHSTWVKILTQNHIWPPKRSWRLNP